MLEAVLAEVRAAGWPAPEDPDYSDDEELPGRADVVPNVVVRLIQETDGRERMLRTWTAQGETVA
ncbi:hypothetical protein ACIQFZ_41345 [Streptomyces sp. NPDC093064]|uniref:hypothetical protein n=1 Tax=unclassified Streptomyces TaxID=2593676 RepID=UPI0036C3E3AE